MKHADDFDDLISLIGAVSIEDEVPGSSNPAKLAFRSRPAEAQMIGADTLSQIRPLLKSGAYGVGCNVTQRLTEEIAVSNGGAWTESCWLPHLLPDGRIADGYGRGGGEGVAAEAHDTQFVQGLVVLLVGPAQNGFLHYQAGPKEGDQKRDRH